MPKPQTVTQSADRARSSSCPARTPTPTSPPRDRRRRRAKRAAPPRRPPKPRHAPAAGTPPSAPRRAVAKQRLFAHPTARRAGRRRRASRSSCAPARHRRRRDFAAYFAAISASTATTSCSSDLQVGAQVVGRHDPRPHRQDLDDTAPHLQLRDPPGRQAAPRGSTRSRSSTAGSCSSRPRSTAPPARTRSSAPDAKNPSIGQILLMSKEALASAVLADPRDPDLRLRPPRHPRRARSTAACSRRSSSSPPRGLKPTVSVAQVRPQLPDDVGQRVRALDRHRRRHRRDQRHPDPRPPGPGLDHRPHDPAPADAAGHDEAAPDHLADDLPGHRQHAVAARPRRPHPRRLPPAVRREPEARAASSARSSSPASGPS